MEHEYRLQPFLHFTSPHTVSFDEFVIDDSLILRGPYGLVRRAALHPGGKKVAVKTARGGPPMDLERIKREVCELSKLRHGNILPILGITTQPSVSIIYPWMNKGNAHDFVQDTTIDPCPLIKDIAEGLNYLHNHHSGPIFHGDLKGLNVLISDDGKALITDFSHVFLPGPSFGLSTQIGRTINWMAPELFDTGASSAESDVWAFGMTVLELFTRKYPFYDCGGVSAILLRILRGAPDRPNAKDTCFRMTDQWWNLLSLCWEESYLRPSMSQVLAKIDQLVNDFIKRGVLALTIPLDE